MYDGDDKTDEENPIIFENKGKFSAYRPNDAVSNHKQVNSLPSINVRTSSTLTIAKTST